MDEAANASAAAASQAADAWPCPTDACTNKARIQYLASQKYHLEAVYSWTQEQIDHAVAEGHVATRPTAASASQTANAWPYPANACNNKTYLQDVGVRRII